MESSAALRVSASAWVDADVEPVPLVVSDEPKGETFRPACRMESVQDVLARLRSESPPPMPPMTFDSLMEFVRKLPR